MIHQERWYREADLFGLPELLRNWERDPWNPDLLNQLRVAYLRMEGPVFDLLAREVPYTIEYLNPEYPPRTNEVTLFEVKLKAPFLHLWRMSFSDLADRHLMPREKSREIRDLRREVQDAVLDGIWYFLAGSPGGRDESGTLLEDRWASFISFAERVEQYKAQAEVLRPVMEEAFRQELPQS